MPDCTCEECIGACMSSPGWFKPGEAEKAAEYMGMSILEFFREYLIVDYWVSSPDILTLAPVKENSPERGGRLASFEYAFGPGRCVFLDENSRCRIHAAKPWECKTAMLCQERPNLRSQISEAWNTPDHQRFLTTLVEE